MEKSAGSNSMHGLESKGYLRSRLQRANGSERRVYRITPHRRRALEERRVKVRELFGELLGGPGKRRPAR